MTCPGSTGWDSSQGNGMRRLEAQILASPAEIREMKAEGEERGEEKEMGMLQM